MKKGKIIFFDDDPKFASQFESLMSDSGFEIISFQKIDDLRSAIADKENMTDVRALIFDLANKKEEELLTENFEILSDIKAQFNQYRIPIFIHSAFSDSIKEFENYGTVWKIEKSPSSIEEISTIVDHLDGSGFLEAFAPNGIIEQSLMAELHKSFTEQFRKGEIVKIIKSIEKDDPATYKERSIEVFKRIAVRALMSQLLSPVVSEGKTVNAIEHYYRRISTLDYWTGDIIIKKDKSHTAIVLTPRCNIASKGTENLMICTIKPDFPKNTSNSKKEIIKKALTDNISYSGSSARYLPPSPLFSGGMVDLSDQRIVSKVELKTNYDVILTLSDDLTNEILGKFAAYFLRTGINTIDLDELIKYIDTLPPDEERK